MKYTNESKPRKSSELSPLDCFDTESGNEGTGAGFFWVEGTPLSPWYCVVILGRDKRKRTRTIERKATSAPALVETMESLGWDIGDWLSVARFCEGADRSQTIVKDPRFGREEYFAFGTRRAEPAATHTDRDTR